MWSQYNAAGQLVNQTTYPEYSTRYSVMTGTTDPGPTSMVSGNVLVIWLSASTGNKTQTIPAPANTGNKITVTDGQGTAGTYTITVSSSGTILGSGIVNSVNVNYASITLIDGPGGWSPA